MRFLPAFAALVATLGLSATAGAHTDTTLPLPPAQTQTLGLEQSRFWVGGTIAGGNVTDTSLCDVQAPCPAWKLDVAGGGKRLRVAYDTPSREDAFRLELTAPDGTVSSEDGSNAFNAEAFVTDPKPGRWTVRMVPRGATHAFFRLRAKLEGPPAAAGAPRRLLPNLRAVPPYEFGFVAPLNPANAAYPPDTVNPPLSVAGQEPLSCAVDESAPVDAGGGGATDCLRLTSGPINLGEGPFVKEFTFIDDVAAGSATVPLLRGQAEQVIYRTDGKRDRRAAGTYSFHTTHAHFHDDNILTYELFRVAGGADGREIVKAGEGTKSGFCPADQLFGDWRSFGQEKSGSFGPGDDPTGNCFSPSEGVLALTTGWGDVYRWQRPGQYVDFGGNGDGYYVVRTTVDRLNTTLETDEDDNSAYALIRVRGRQIETVERGWGTSHVDPAKTVFHGLGPSSKDVAGELPAKAEAPKAGSDETPLRVSAMKLEGRTLRFTLSEPASVVVTVVAKGKRVSRRTIAGVAGANRVTLRKRPKGRFVLALAARDAAGNAATPVRLTVR